jgi:hypothetical protein
VQDGINDDNFGQRNFILDEDKNGAVKNGTKRDTKN